MEESRVYINILMESLKKKILVLDRIILKNTEQKEIISIPDLDEGALRRNLEEKDDCINELNRLDQGFDSIYEKVKIELMNNKDKYADEITQLQTLIREITNKSMDIQVSEKRNKELMIKYFNKVKGKIKQAKIGKNVAANYYKSMNRVDYYSPQFLDKKK